MCRVVLVMPDECARDVTAPRWLWWTAVGGTALVVLLVGVTALALALGAADPPTAGPVVWTDAALDWAAEAGERDSGTWWTAPTTLPQADGVFTLSVRATLPAEDDPLAAWGVWVANTEGTRTLYALSGESGGGGYWTIRICPAEPAPLRIEDCPAPRDEWRWLAYPRIQALGQPNTITLHREAAGALRLRINNELLGAPVVLTEGAWGVWARGAVAWGEASIAAAQ